MTDVTTFLYGLSLFVHILGTIALFGGFILAQRGVEMDQARKMIPSGGAMILVGGLSMVALGHWRLGTPWIGVPLLALLALVPLAMLGLRDPPRPVLRWTANGLALAAVWNMTTKLDGALPLVAVLVGAAGGW